MKQQRYTIRPVGKSFVLGLMLALLVFSAITSYSAYSYKREALLLQCEATLADLREKYAGKVYSLADVYEPIFASDQSTRQMRAYFDTGIDPLANGALRAGLVDILAAMMAQDADIEWIALWNPELEQNHCLLRGGSRLSALPADFAYAAQAQGGFHVSGAKAWVDENGYTRLSYVIQGGGIPVGKPGGILVGYSLEPLARIVERSASPDAVEFLVLAGDEVAFDSSAKRYGQAAAIEDDLSQSGWHTDGGGRRWYASSYHDAGRGFTVAYRFPGWQLFWLANESTPAILLVLSFFTLFAQGLYMLSTRRIMRRVSEIKTGLAQIGQNRLNCRLALSSRHDEFDEVSESINSMAALLELSVEKAYEMRIRQVQLELSQIQARFNPHFLYNTLEIIRGRLCTHGDMETAEYVEKLLRIFRNLTDARSVVTIRDEISFCSLYIALLQIRYQNAVDVYYGIEPELQDCGILSNLIQPVIENYFVHALDETDENNAIEISCVPEGERDITITISNNGQGLSPRRIDEINRELKNPDIASKSYGLMSIARRVLLFYGPEYGIRLEPNDEAGLRVIISIARMSVQAHEKKLLLHK